MQLSPNSFWVKAHNFLADVGSNFWYRPEGTNRLRPGGKTDICSFMRRFILWTPIYAAVYGIYYFLLYMFLYQINANIYGAGIVGISYITVLIGAICLTFVILLVCGLVWLWEKYTDNRDKKAAKYKEPGVVKTWWTAVKTKTCSFILIKE